MVVVLNNRGNRPLDWSVGFEVEGRITSGSGAEWDRDAGYVTFTPLFWNTPIDADGQRQFELIGAR